MRLRDWNSRLTDTIHQWRSRPFGWSADLDCVAFAADCVRAVTGDQLRGEWPGAYTTAEGALAAMHKSGITSLAQGLARHFEERPPAFACSGDLALVPSPEQGPFPDAIGVVVGAIIFVRTRRGLGVVKLSKASTSFMVV